METILFLAVASIVVLLLMVLLLNSALDGVANLAASLDKQVKLNENQVVKDQIQAQFNAEICKLMHLIATRVDEHSIKFKELK